ncbi:alpha/beta-hydrolase [Atractiella rhizophila]|nr:alpha/beta-hydrolase [Atractiella rhizophila]
MLQALARFAVPFLLTQSTFNPLSSDVAGKPGGKPKFPVPPFAQGPAGKWITSSAKRVNATPFAVSNDVIHSALLLPQLAPIASAAYCGDATIAWDCKPCKASGLEKPNWYLEHKGDDVYPGVYIATFPGDPNTVYIFREGSKTWSELWDDLVYSWVIKPLDPSLINRGKGAHPTGAEWVNGFFLDTYLQTNERVLKAVRDAINHFPNPSKGLIILTGHSLGGAVSVLDSLQLRINIDPDIPIQTVGYGQPRTGNGAFAVYYDQLLGNNTLHYTNWRDPVPRLPAKFLGFEQTQNEFFNQTTYECLRCPDCSICDVNKEPEAGCDPFSCNANNGQVNYCPVDTGRGTQPFENWLCADQFGAADDPSLQQETALVDGADLSASGHLVAGELGLRERYKAADPEQVLRGRWTVQGMDRWHDQMGDTMFVISGLRL